MWEEVESFLDYLAREKGASSHTIAAYRNDLSQFLQHLSARGVPSWPQVSQEHVFDFLHWLQENQYVVSTVARKVAAVRSFFHYLVEQGLLVDDPSVVVSPPRVPRKRPRFLSSDEISRFFDGLRGGSSPKSLRDLALLELLYDTGMRASEVIELRTQDVDLDGGTVHCQSDEGRERSLPLTPRVVEVLRTYLQRGRPRLVRDEAEEMLFVNHRGRPLTRQGLWLIIKERSEKAGIESGVTPHMLRHSFAAHLLEEGVALREVQGRMGHASLSATQVYLQGDE